MHHVNEMMAGYMISVSNKEKHEDSVFLKLILKCVEREDVP